MSYAARAERFVAERRLRAVPEREREISEISEERGGEGDLSSLISLISRPANPADDATGDAIFTGRDGEISEKSEETPGVWWDDPTRRALTPNADDFDRALHASTAQILHFPPRGCIAPVACSRLGECDRRRDGRPCGVAS